jgi:hypothetical protein
MVDCLAANPPYAVIHRFSVYNPAFFAFFLLQILVKNNFFSDCPIFSQFTPALPIHFQFSLRYRLISRFFELVPKLMCKWHKLYANLPAHLQT